MEALSDQPPLCLPFPPSVNHYWRMWRGRMVISREGRAFREDVCALLARRNGNGPRKPPSGGRIALCMDAYPPDRRRRDLDNLSKSALDALQHAGAYVDDSQIDLLVAQRRQIASPGRVEVRIFDLPMAICPLCGAAWSPEDN